jgi:hypothetical protein
MLVAVPKPQRPRRGDAECLLYMEEVAKQPCVIGDKNCTFWPVIVHHCIHGRFAGRRASDFDTIPLCPTHHDPTSPHGIHHSPDAWREKHGEDTSYIPLVRAVVDMP